MDRTTMVLSSLLQPAAVASSVVPVNNNNNNSCAHKKKKQQWRQDDHANGSGSVAPLREEEEQESSELRRGPWSVDEDLLLVNYISTHGEGRWNSLARSAGLKRTGKSCRLRWLNYLRPDVRRGNITPEEQLLILDLHSRWGNRWSKIAQQLPGRTDNEIKNYWRTRVQKHAKQLRCDVNSKQFKDLMRYLWIPRLLERIRSSRHNSSTTTADRGSDMDSGKEQSSSSSSISSNDNLLQVQDGAGGSKETMQQQLASDVSYEHLDDLSLWSGVELQLPESLWSHEDDHQLW